MFKDLHIENFRGIRNSQIEGFEKINVLFGRNNCGKSTILEALFLISGQSNPALPLTINSMRNFSSHREQDLNIDFFNLDSNNRIIIAANGSTKRTLEISIIKSRSKEINLTDLGVGASDNASNHYGLKMTYSLGNSQKYKSEIILEDGNDTGKINVDKRYIEPLFSMYIPSSYTQTPLADQYSKIIENKEELNIISILKELEPRIIDLTLAGNELLVDIGARQRLPLNMMGDGLRKLLSIIISIYRTKNGLLLIDEVDNGFHYATMKLLWKAIIKTAVLNNVQVFATTHNIDSLKGLNAVLKEEGQNEYQSHIGAFKIIKDNECDVTALKYDYKSFDYSINQEMEMR